MGSTTARSKPLVLGSKLAKVVGALPRGQPALKDAGLVFKDVMSHAGLSVAAYSTGHVAFLQIFDVSDNHTRVINTSC